MKCQRCGRCCTYLDECRTVSELSVVDRERLTPEERKFYVREDRGRIGIRAYNARGRTICHALDVRTDGTRRCAIYAHRPQQCRDWKPGSRLCAHLRTLSLNDCGLEE